MTKSPLEPIERDLENIVKQTGKNEIKNSSIPRDAATVILTRDTGEKPFEIFLMRRHKNQAFMGGAFVFPGGRLDESDCDPELATFAQGLSAEDASYKLNEPDIPENKALGLYFAAVRETFEESGVLLATPATGGSTGLINEKNPGRFESYRKKIHEGEMSLAQIAGIENINFKLDLLMPYSRWITPEIESRRFDTRFLIARMPREQRTIHDAIEMTESLWITPADALKKQQAGNLLLMPPTLKTIEELYEFSSIDQMFSTAASRRIQPILPQTFPVRDGFGIKLPHDPEYSITDYKQPHRPEEPSRIMIMDGKWKTIRLESIE